MNLLQLLRQLRPAGKVPCNSSKATLIPEEAWTSSCLLFDDELQRRLRLTIIGRDLRISILKLERASCSWSPGLACRLSSSHDLHILKCPSDEGCLQLTSNSLSSDLLTEFSVYVTHTCVYMYIHKIYVKSMQTCNKFTCTRTHIHMRVCAYTRCCMLSDLDNVLCIFTFRITVRPWHSTCGHPWTSLASAGTMSCGTDLHQLFMLLPCNSIRIPLALPPNAVLEDCATQYSR